MMLAGVLALAALAAPALALAQDAGVPDAMRVAWQDVAPHVDTARGAVVTVALGAADDRRGPLSAQRLWARRDAQARALAALHAWADAAIARAALAPPSIAALHRAIDEHAQVTTTRARVDGSACVEVIVPVQDLAASTPGTRGLPWSA